MEKILIGKIVNSVGLKGQVKVYNYSYEDRFEDLEKIYIKHKTDFTQYEIESVRNQKNMIVIKLKNVDDRNGAEALRDREVYILEEDLRELPSDTFYIRDLIGMKVLDFEDSKEIGVLTGVTQGSAQDIYQIKTLSGKEFLLPAVGEFVKEISKEDRLIKIKLIAGFIDEGIEA